MVHGSVDWRSGEGCGVQCSTVRYYEDARPAGRCQPDAGRSPCLPAQGRRAFGADPAVPRFRDVDQAGEDFGPDRRDRPASCDNALDVVTHHRDALRVRIVQRRRLTAPCL